MRLKSNLFSAHHTQSRMWGCTDLERAAPSLMHVKVLEGSDGLAEALLRARSTGG